jgi:translocation and assembly module TamA
LRPIGVILAGGLWLALSGPGAAEVDVQDRSPPASEDAEEAPLLAYEIEIFGVAEKELKEILLKTSRLLELQERAPATISALERRLEEDRARFTKALRSEGYYDSTIQFDLDRDTTPLTININIETGAPYRLERYDIVYVGRSSAAVDLPRDIAELGLELGMPAKAKAVVEAQVKLLRLLAETGRPLAKVTDQRAEVDHAKAGMSVTLSVDPGPESRFGGLVFEGLADVEEAYLRRILDWRPGAVYDQRVLDGLSDKLRETGLFDSVKFEPAPDVDATGQIAVTILLAERKPRSIGAGVSFATDEGFGAEAFWEHRNIFGAQETLSVELEGTEIRQELTGAFKKPNFLRLDQSLLLETSALAQQTDAFEEQSLGASIGLERPVFDDWKARADIAVEYSRIDDNEGDDDFLLVGLPLTLSRDSSDDLLNPTRGMRLALAAAPYGDIFDTNLFFMVNEANVSAYFAPFDQDRVVLAGRARLGSIIGDQSDDIPANKRFFSGGGGSVRGYEFQSVGPLDDDNDPLGGRSVVEVGLELRFRIGESFGIVPFIEGGNVYDDVIPKAFEDAQWAAGIGLRYFTAIGPVRLDVGVPLNKRDSDDDFQFYVSIGQAF